MYVIGIDAGGTKTHCMIADAHENIIGEGFAGAAQHQVYGVEQTKQNLRLAIGHALSNAALTPADIAFACLGMSGADGADDFALLSPAVQKILGDIPFEIVHDAWIGLHSATDEPSAVVSICGTGAAHAGKNSRGEHVILRNLDYITGNYGGGGDLAQKALHYAFRSNEGTYEKSALEDALPSVFGVSTMDEVCGILKHGAPNDKQRYRLPILVFELAGQGDKVCAQLLENMGREEGRYAAAVIRRLHLCSEKIPVVLIGSLFRTGEPLLLTPFMDSVHEAAPQAYPVIPDAAPVTGAIRLALAHLE